MTLSAFGCAQIAGLGGDYHHASPGAAGDDSGQQPHAGSGGKTNEPQAGAPGDSGGRVSGGSATGGSATGGTGGNAGTEALGGDGSTPGGAGGAGPGVSPVRIGFSEFHDSASGNDNASSHLADATFAMPTGTSEGDLMLVFFGSDHSLGNLSGANLGAKGWTLIDQQHDYGTDGQATYLAYKLVTSAEPDPVVFSNINGTPSGNGVQGLLSVYRGVNPSAPVNAYEVTLVPTGEKGITQAVTKTPAITTKVDNCLLIAGLSPDTAVDTPQVVFWPVGFTENQVSVINPAHPYPFGWADIYQAERHLPKAGTVAASSFTWVFGNATEYYGSLAFVLALAPQ
jgi:hypothetical protein